MKHTKILLLLLMAAGMVTFQGCEKDKLQCTDITFNAIVEQPTDESKVHLIDERWVYWEPGDRISIMGDQGGDQDGNLGTAYLASNVAGDFSDYNGVFHTSLVQGSQYFLGLFPENTGNEIIPAPVLDTFYTTINLNTTQAWRNDITFGRNVMPMVAWYGGSWEDPHYTPFNLNFFLLGGIVRLEIINESSSPVTLDHIEIRSRDAKKLAGAFTVEKYKTHQPFLSDGTESTITLPYGGDELQPNEIATFYLVLPALGNNSVTTKYSLTMEAVTNDSKHCIKNFNANVRRGGITYMRALGVDEWNDGTGNANVRLVGDGSEARPFKIYTIEDLKYLRDCYNGTERTINGQPITSNTHVRIMRSDIPLTSADWLVGIRNFVGHLTSVATTSHPGIIDQCDNSVPLFESIDEDGVVEGLTLKCAFNFNITNPTGLSPFCSENAGIIRNCVLTTVPDDDSYSTSIFSSLAGICVTNTGTIEGCRCEGRIEVQSSKDFAGICLHNQASGIIQGCQASGMVVRVQGRAAGICYENSGRVIDSYFATSITGSSADWGGIVYENSGTVEHCYLSASGHIYTSKSVGGIVRTNKGSSSKVNYCWLAGPLKGTTAGGIVDSMAGGQIINCFNSGDAMITVTTTTSKGGGLAGRMTGGSITNSYVNGITLLRDHETANIGGIVGVVSDGIIDNCYSKESNNAFYGSKSGGTITHSHLVNGSQTGVNTVNSSTTDAYVTLQDKLNCPSNDAEDCQFPAGAKEWIDASGNTTPPKLKAY